MTAGTFIRKKLKDDFYTFPHQHKRSEILEWMQEFSDQEKQQLEQRNRELVEALRMYHDSPLSPEAAHKAQELLSKHSAPAGQKGGENEPV